MSKKLILFISGFSLFILFIIFSYIVHEDFLTSFDFNTTVRLQDKIGRNWDSEFSILSDLGKFEITTVVLGILIIFLFIRKKLLAAITAGVLYVGFHIIELFGKFFVDHPPPPQFMLRTEQIFTFPQFHVRSESSYPSGHAGRAVFVSVLLLTIIWQSKKISKWMKLGLTGLILGYDAAMLISRPTLGEHWTTDVVGGALLGLSFGLITAGFLVGKGKLKDFAPQNLFPKYKIEIKKVE